MSFQRAEQLKSHKICVHQAIHPHVCDVCGRYFGSSSTLKAHILTHTGERPHACDMCDKTFSLVNNLNVHKRNVHLGQRTHQCNQCGKGLQSLYVHFFCVVFATESIHLESFQVLHANVICSIIWARTRQRSRIRVHIAINHSRNRRICCAIKR